MLDALKAVWAKVPDSWKDRAYGAAGSAILVYGGPKAKELADVVWPCIRAHYGF